MLGDPIKEAFLSVIKRFLTPPATSTRVERLFSSAGLLLDEKRARLDPKRVNRILFCRENMLLMNFDIDW